jgi:adenosylmethionine-8-amino-7-oxononanoate aminotransferase
VHRIVSGKVLEAGVLMRPLPFIETLGISPPLTMTRSDADEAVERIGKGFDAAVPDMKRLAGA